MEMDVPNTSVPQPLDNVLQLILPPVHQSIVFGDLGEPGLPALLPVEMELELKQELEQHLPKMEVLTVPDLPPTLNHVHLDVVPLLVKSASGLHGDLLVQPLVELELKPEPELSPLLPSVEDLLETVTLFLHLDHVPNVFQETVLEPTLPEAVSVLQMDLEDIDLLHTEFQPPCNMVVFLVLMLISLNGTSLVPQVN